jgi:LPXTG-motif cell wall-anchored protein
VSLTLTARKLLKLSGAAVVGTAVAAIFAAPAFAWSGDASGSGACTDQGNVTITWTVTNNEAHFKASFEVTDHEPSASVIENVTGELPKGGTATITQTGVPSESVARITVHLVWKDSYGNVKDEADVKGKFEGQKCEKPSPSPSASPSASPSVSPTNGGGGGGEGTPTPSTTPSTPTLPVTGPNTAIYGGGAAALLVAGGTLFFVARRRRIRFEA